ncbi:MAG TPA: DUF4266 domain-containing protein [Burkholderiaceae bacterium]|jgi:Domain of unknown function (DUF4266)|nr:DUF4266 domain-containing protein [Burkholderiaceae bacterium]
MTTVRCMLMRGALLVVAASVLAGCSIQPWVKPYERERLADPLMALSRNGLADKHRDHVFDVREASRGATGVQGSGCGCN